MKSKETFFVLVLYIVLLFLIDLSNPTISQIGLFDLDEEMASDDLHLVSVLFIQTIAHPGHSGSSDLKFPLHFDFGHEVVDLLLICGIDFSVK